MIGVIIILVLGISVLIYGKTNNYGEAALALVAGLLTAFTVTWTPLKFIGFTTAWVGFSLLVLLISSVKLAVKVESLYKRAAISIDSSNAEEIEKQLRKAAETTPLGMLDPIEKAEIILQLAFRKFPLSLMKYAVASIEQLFTVTKVEPKTITLFLVDLYKTLDTEKDNEHQQKLEDIFTLLRETPASPEDFFRAFMITRRLVLSSKIGLTSYFHLLRKGLDQGLSPDDMFDYMNELI